MLSAAVHTLIPDMACKVFLRLDALLYVLLSDTVADFEQVSSLIEMLLYCQKSFTFLW